MNKIITVLFVLFISACNSKEDLRVDLHSFSEPHHVVTTHLDLDVEIDFEKEIISGEARYEIQNLTGHNQLILDVNGLEIEKVTIDNKASSFI